MKFTVALLVASICLVGLIDALPNERSKRALALEKCPQDISCEGHAQQKFNKMNSCVGYDLSDNTIEWKSCGEIRCRGDTSLGKEDLSKPYPDCCAECG